MPTPRFLAAAAVANGRLYVVSGRNGEYQVVGLNHYAADSVLEAYDPVAAKWSELAPMPKWRDDVAAGSVNGIVYVIGGSDFGGYSARLDAYDPASNSWSPRTPMRDPRDGPTVAVANGILYVMGGGDSAALAYANGRPYTPPLTSVMEAYDPSTDSWTTKAPLPEPLNLAGAGVVNGILYLIGGLSLTGDSASASVYAYDPSSNTWTKKAPMPTARYGLDVGVVNGILYAVGGIGNPQWTYLATVEAYDPATDTWSEKPPISLARCCLNVAGIGDRLYAVGGGRESFVDGHDIVTGLLEVYSPK